MQHQIRLKVQHKLYYSQRYVSPTVAEAILNLFLTHFSPFSKYNAKPSLNTKWCRISMKCFHFSEQRFPCICLNKVPIVSVQHFILSRLVQTLSNTLPLSAISIYNNSLRVLECNQSKQLWHSVVCSVAPEDDKLPLMLSCWSTNDFLFCFTITYWPVWTF